MKKLSVCLIIVTIGLIIMKSYGILDKQFTSETVFCNGSRIDLVKTANIDSRGTQLTMMNGDQLIFNSVPCVIVKSVK